MNRRDFLTRVGAAGLLLGTPALAYHLRPGGASMNASSRQERDEIAKLTKSKDEWREILEPEAYRVLFEEATERPFTSPLNDEERAGTFVCAACFLPLFDSEAKFDSGTGWPSFYQPLEGHVGTKKDFKMIWPRTEYHCIRCGGHQGHVFKDGPPPTGQRWCNNGVALQFVPRGDELPALRT